MFVVERGKFALASFGIALGIDIFLISGHIWHQYRSGRENQTPGLAPLNMILISAFLLGPSVVIPFLLRRCVEVTIRAGGLGCICGIGMFLTVAAATPAWQHFGLYLSLFAIFHWSEFVTVAMINPKSLKLDSFLLNHSRQYWLAAGASWLEFVIEAELFGGSNPDGLGSGWKNWRGFAIIGLLLCLGGEAMRKLAIITAGRSFTHLIAYQRNDSHRLVTHGVYGLVRHPAYVGWFWWSIGTQILLGNPICLAGYAVAAWNFFNDRIYEEEVTLLNFYREDYVEYQRRVPVGIPGIRGYAGR